MNNRLIIIPKCQSVFTNNISNNHNEQNNNTQIKSNLFNTVGLFNPFTYQDPNYITNNNTSIEQIKIDKNKI